MPIRSGSEKGLWVPDVEGRTLDDDDKAWLRAAAWVVFSAIVTAGADAIAAEVKERWASKRRRREEAEKRATDAKEPRP